MLEGSGHFGVVMRDRRPFMSHSAGGLLLRSTARMRASIVCSLSGHDYDATGLPRSSLVHGATALIGKSPPTSKGP